MAQPVYEQKGAGDHANAPQRLTLDVVNAQAGEASAPPGKDQYPGPDEHPADEQQLACRVGHRQPFDQGVVQGEDCRAAQHARNRGCDLRLAFRQPRRPDCHRVREAVPGPVSRLRLTLPCWSIMAVTRRFGAGSWHPLISKKFETASHSNKYRWRGSTKQIAIPYKTGTPVTTINEQIDIQPRRAFAMALMVVSSVGISFGGLILRSMEDADVWQINFYGRWRWSSSSR